MDADPTATEALLLGAIDCGSNAIRMVIAECDGPGSLKQVAYLRAPVRLGTRAFTRRQLARDALENAIDAFKRFRSMFDEHGVKHYRAVATSAVRNANNPDGVGLEFLARDMGGVHRLREVIRRLVEQ